MGRDYDQHRHDHDKGIRRKLRWLVRFPKFWQSPINRAVVDLAAPVPGERALDVGAGMGPATVLAARRGASVVAVDPSRFMRVILGLRRQGQRNPSRITVEAGAAEDLPLAGGSIEVAFTVNAIHHWTDLEAAVSELARVLAPRGRALLVDEDFTHPDHPQHETHHDHEQEMTVVDVEAIASMFRGVGLDATGERTFLAAVPVKVVRITRTGA